MEVSKDQILKTITDFYLRSSDFNGIPINELLQTLSTTWNEVREIIQELILQRNVALRCD